MDSITDTFFVLLFTLSWIGAISLTVILLKNLAFMSDYVVEDMEEKASIVISDAGGTEDEIILVDGYSVYSAIANTPSTITYSITVGDQTITNSMLRSYESQNASSLRALREQIVNLHGKYRRSYKYDNDCNLIKISYSY
ncbi:MAG: hypothetical protein K2K56_13275 [Lachnospiraceae bacterium]|nr:hypothetical protein [Lachnospiraceae bacterium]